MSEDATLMLIERLAHEALQWSRDPKNNHGGDPPSLVFARRFAFLLERRGQTVACLDALERLPPPDAVQRTTEEKES